MHPTARCALLLFLLGCNPHIPEKITLGMNESYYGYIDEGAKFGVAIGMSLKDSRIILTEAGQNDPKENICTEKSRFGCIEGEIYDDYYWSANVPSKRNKKINRKTGMKYGWIAIFIEDDKVSAIGWSFYNTNIDP